MKTERKDDESSITQTRESERQNGAEAITLMRGAAAVTGTHKQKMNMNTRRMTNTIMSPEEYIVMHCLQLEKKVETLEHELSIKSDEVKKLLYSLEKAETKHEDLVDFLQKYGEKCEILSVKDKAGNRDYDFISFYSVGSNDEDYDVWLKLLGLTGEPNA